MSDESHESDESNPRAPAGELPAPLTTLAELLEGTVARPEPSSATPSCMIGECIAAQHPTLQGRVQVRFATSRGGPELERWVPKLQSLPVRAGDRVMMIRPDNAQEWIVTGVIDGFATRPEVQKSERARIELERDEAISVVSSEGTPLVEISQGQAGPCIKVLEPDVQVEFAGKLALRAKDIELVATQGEVAVTASADVVLKGETIRLN
jgi:hypothetical protein